MRRVEQLDPVSIVAVLHGLGLAAFGQVQAPLAVVALTLLLGVWRVGLGITAASRPAGSGRLLLTRGVGSLLLAGGVVVADGGTESPFFFWLLLLLAWQSLRFDRRSLIRLTTVGILVYVGVVVAATDLTPASIARFGLFLTFVLVLVAGRVLLEESERRARRLEEMVVSVVEGAPMGVAVYASDRATLLYANTRARELGLDGFERMARLRYRDAREEGEILTLAGLVGRAGWEGFSPRRFTPVGEPDRLLRIGFQPRRPEAGEPFLLVYGDEEDGLFGGTG